MRRALLPLIVLLLFAAPLAAEDSPHQMLLPDGTPDTDKCGLCHEDDLTLSRSKEETCTFCHTIGQHAGSLSHLHARPEQVKRLLPAAKPGEPTMPLTDAGGMYCGTCHLMHDPQGVVTSEPWQPSGCPQSTSAFSTAVRSQLEQYRDSVADAQAAHFVGQGTRALRYPVCGGILCLHCHSDKR